MFTICIKNGIINLENELGGKSMSKYNNQTKQQIIDVTKTLLKEQGNLTIKDIAEKAYVNVAAINYYFGSKDNLIKIILEEVIFDLRNEIVKSIQKNEEIGFDFNDLMIELIEMIIKFADNNTGIINYSFLQMASGSDEDNILIDFFLNDYEFMEMILGQLSNIFPNVSKDQLNVKYVIIFSSFIVPFFINFARSQRVGKKDEDFLSRYMHLYIEELKRFITP